MAGKYGKGSRLHRLSHLHLCPEMHLTLNFGTLYKTELFVIFIHDFMFDCVF